MSVNTSDTGAPEHDTGWLAASAPGTKYSSHTMDRDMNMTSTPKMCSSTNALFSVAQGTQFLVSASGQSFER